MFFREEDLMRKTRENIKDHPEDLYVYECHGPRYPQEEPTFGGFLGIWPEPPFYYFFFDRPVLSEVRRWIEDRPGWSLKQGYQLDYHQWQQMTHQDQKIGPFIIRTGASSSDPSEGGILLQLHAGLSFGSGLHPTTKGCLLSLSALYEKYSPSTVADLGTGTGILALACARLGARKVWAPDCNFLAAREARRNIRLNGLENTVHLLVSQNLNVFRHPAELLVMNIEWPCLQKVLKEEDLRGYRWMILSGFLEAQEEELKHLIPSGFFLVSRLVPEGWTTLTLQNLRFA